MDDTDLQIVRGQISAINLALIQLMINLPAVAAAQTALALAIEKEGSNRDDIENSTPPQESQVRNIVLDGYLNLLQSVSARG